MNAETAAIVISTITQFGAIAAVWVKARAAAHSSKPTGNGFASDVRNALRRIEAKMDNHLRDHVRGDTERHNRHDD